ncbi:MAG TPA: hypothetical protein VFW88_06945 [Burkholderiales bacterium]|nr:hypothetical protein [Burkholderiales bacterium]
MSESFSRSPTPHPLGKCDTELKTQVPERLRDELATLATLNGQTVSEYLRDMVTLHLHGYLDVARMAVKRMNGQGENAP